MIGVLDKARGAQPEYAVLTVIEFRSVMIVRVDGMQGRVPVCDRLRVISIRLMKMLLGQDRRADKPRCQGESDERAAEPCWHRRDYGPRVMNNRCLFPRRSSSAVIGARHR